MDTNSIVLNFTPSTINPRNSEGAFYTLSNGYILFFYSCFIGLTPDDDATANLALVRSDDGGRTWSDPEILFTAASFGVKNLMSISTLKMKNGDLGLFFIIRKGWHDTRLHLSRSADDGKTWSEPVCCIPWQGYHVTNNDRVIRLSTGRILVPVAYHKPTCDFDNPACTINPCGVLHFFYSDDDGLSFHETPQSVPLSHSCCRSGLQEPGIIELFPGLLWCWARTDLGRQYECFSFDDGFYWTPPEPSRFTSPCSPLSMKRCPDGRLLAVWNPIPNYQTREANPMGWGRTPLVAAFSCDEGKSFSNPIILEDDPESGYCYIAIHFIEDAVLLSYCAGGHDHICLSELRIRRIPLGQL